MITQTMLDFSNVVLSRRRKPFYSKRLKCWYFKDAAGKQYRLHSDEQRALELWRAIMGPEPEPVVVPGIVEQPRPATVKVKRIAIVKVKRVRPEKPAKPYEDFPLYAHNNGQWARKVNGQTRFYGAWADWRAALELYEATKPEKPVYRKYDRTRAPRLQAKTVRILKLIDLLASFRFPKRLEEIHALITEAVRADWHPRTTERDLYVIESLGLLEVSQYGFKLNLNRSERLQTTALALFG